LTRTSSEIVEKKGGKESVPNHVEGGEEKTSRKGTRKGKN